MISGAEKAAEGRSFSHRSTQGAGRDPPFCRHHRGPRREFAVNAPWPQEALGARQALRHLRRLSRSQYFRPDPLGRFHTHYFLVFGLGFIWMPPVAVPICCCLRLYRVLLSPRWPTVLDWAVTHVAGVAGLAIAYALDNDSSIYLYFGSAGVLATFPVFAFERIFGSIVPKSPA